jgi:hypothetical protein
MFANYRNIQGQDYAHLAPQKVKKRDTFEEWLYRRKEEDAITNEFHRHPTTGSITPTSKKLDPIA